MSAIFSAISGTLRAAERVSPALAAEGAFTLWVSPAGRKKVHPSEQPVMEQAKVFTLTAEGKRVVAYRWGSGPRPVLLVHGWRSRAATFAPLVRELRAANRTIIAFDAPAHGDSGGRRTDIREYAAVIAELERRYGPFEAIVAHSFGVLASVLAIHNGVRAGRLVSLAGVPRFDFLVTSFAATFGLGDAVVRGIRQRIERRIFTNDADIWTEFSAVARPLPAEIPLLVIHDEDDTEVSIAEARTLVDAHPASVRVVTTTGLGHNRVLRDDAVLDAVASFLAEAEVR